MGDSPDMVPDMDSDSPDMEDMVLDTDSDSPDMLLDMVLDTDLPDMEDMASVSPDMVPDMVLVSPDMVPDTDSDSPDMVPDTDMEPGVSKPIYRPRKAKGVFYVNVLVFAISFGQIKFLIYYKK